MAAAIMARHPAAPLRVPAVHLPAAVVAHPPAAARHRLAWQQAAPVLRPAPRVRLHQAQVHHLVQAQVAAVLVASLATM